MLLIRTSICLIFWLSLCAWTFVIKMSRYVSQDYLPASGAFVGLSAPGEVGSWQRECKVINFLFQFHNEYDSEVKTIHYCLPPNENQMAAPLISRMKVKVKPVILQFF